MKKTIYFLLISLMAAPVFGQKVNFSGTWMINREKSELNADFSFAPDKVILTQDKKALSVERHSTWQGEKHQFTSNFTLDGAECENPGFMEGTITKSTAVWGDDKKTLTITTKAPMQDGGEMSIVAVYTLAGDNLSIKSTANSDYGEMIETYVFDKQ